METFNHKKLEDAPNGLMSIIAGLNYLQGEAHEAGLDHAARLLKITVQDIITWAKNSYHVNKKSDEYLKQLVADSSLYYAFEFLAKFALLDDQLLKKEVVKAITSFTDKKRNLDGVKQS